MGGGRRECWHLGFGMATIAHAHAIQRSARSAWVMLRRPLAQQGGVTITVTGSGPCRRAIRPASRASYPPACGARSARCAGPARRRCFYDRATVRIVRKRAAAERTPRNRSRRAALRSRPIRPRRSSSPPASKHIPLDAYPGSVKLDRARSGLGRRQCRRPGTAGDHEAAAVARFDQSRPGAQQAVHPRHRRQQLQRPDPGDGGPVSRRCPAQLQRAGSEPQSLRHEAHRGAGGPARHALRRKLCSAASSGSCPTRPIRTRRCRHGIGRCQRHPIRRPGRGRRRDAQLCRSSTTASPSASSCFANARAPAISTILRRRRRDINNTTSYGQRTGRADRGPLGPGRRSGRRHAQHRPPVTGNIRRRGDPPLTRTMRHRRSPSRTPIIWPTSPRAGRWGGPSWLSATSVVRHDLRTVFDATGYDGSPAPARFEGEQQHQARQPRNADRPAAARNCPGSRASSHYLQYQRTVALAGVAGRSGADSGRRQPAGGGGGVRPAVEAALFRRLTGTVGGTASRFSRSVGNLLDSPTDKSNEPFQQRAALLAALSALGLASRRTVFGLLPLSSRATARADWRSRHRGRRWKAGSSRPTTSA